MRKVPWWQTVPTLLTGAAGAFGALAGLLAILFQIGFFSQKTDATLNSELNDGLIKRDSIQSVTELLRQFDLLGNWAVNCGLAAAPDNPHVAVLSPVSGPAIEIHDLGPELEPNRYVIASVSRASIDVLSLKALVWPGTSEQQIDDLVLVVGEGTRRTISNRPEGRTLSVRAGINQNGKETPLLHKCR